MVHNQWLKGSRVPTQTESGVIGVNTANENTTSDPHAWVGWPECMAEVSNAGLVIGDLRPVLSHSTGAPVFGCTALKVATMPRR